LKFIRFENQIQQLGEDCSPNKLEEFNSKHKYFFELYNSKILGIGSYRGKVYDERLKGFLNDKIISQLFNSVDSIYGNFEKEENELTEFFKRYKAFFPQRTIPQIYTFVSGFAYAIAPTDSVLGIGLDYFLGKTRNYYTLLDFPEYQKRKLNQNYISITAAEQWIRSEFESDSLNKDLLSQIIAEGKVLYTTKQCMPEIEDTLLFGYTKSQLDWCIKSEFSIWSFLVDKKLLYLTNKTEYNRYISDGPFTPGMPRESPARATFWLGYQIVEAFMKHQKNMNLERLMSINNAQYILNNSKYKPHK
jgi:hypothetical protein